MAGSPISKRISRLGLVALAAILVCAASPVEDYVKRYADERQEMVQRLEGYADALARARAAIGQAERAIALARELRDDQALRVATQAKVRAEQAVQRVLRYQANQRDRLRTFDKRSSYLIDAGRVDYVSRFKGTVTRTGGKDLDAPLAPGDTVTTGQDGFIEVSFLGGSSMTIGPNTTLRLLDTDEVTYYQLRGAVYHMVRCVKSRAACEMGRRTPGGAVAVRGTAFETDVDADGSTTIRTFEGKVTFTPNPEGAPEIEIPAGRQVTVAKDGRVLDRGPVGKAKAAGWNF